MNMHLVLIAQSHEPLGLFAEVVAQMIDHFFSDPSESLRIVSSLVKPLFFPPQCDEHQWLGIYEAIEPVESIQIPVWMIASRFSGDNVRLKTLP